MLKTNTKKATENLKQYIINNFDGSNYTETPPEDWHEIATFILNAFRSEKYSMPEDYRYYKNNELAAFVDWCSGLPSVLDTCYYYNRSAADDLAAILEEDENEKKKYTEQQSEFHLSFLIYRTLLKEETKK